MKRQGLLGPWRRALQWVSSLTLLSMPFVRINGESLLRLDLPTQTLYAGSFSLPIEELYLFLFFAVALILLFLLVTLVFGRAWCGWACPQTTLSDLVEGFSRHLGRSPDHQPAAPLWTRALLHLFCLGLALLVAANLVWYFLSPYEFFPRLLEGRLGAAAGWSLGVIAAIVYVDLAFIRRLLCKEFCPYGRFQCALVDPGTLTLRFHPADAKRCIRCDACVRSCPMDIDVRCGYQIECIHCGRCLDACREVMAHRRQAGIIRYTFGLGDLGAKALLNPRLLLVTVALVAVLSTLVATLLLRSEVTFKLGRPGEQVASSLGEEQTINFYQAVIGNRQRRPLELRTRVLADDGQPLRVFGTAEHFTLAGRERRRLDFAVVAPTALTPARVRVQLRDETGRVVAEEYIHLVRPIPDKETP